MRNPMASVHDGIKAKMWRSSDNFGLRSPVIQKSLQTKSATSIVARANKVLSTENTQLFRLFTHSICSKARCFCTVA